MPHSPVEFFYEIEYLKSINIKPKNEFLNTSNLDRAVQLMKKTNQFNFSNLSYDHDQIKFFAKSNICFFNGMYCCRISNARNY